MKKRNALYILSLLLVLIQLGSHAQTIGGNSSYNFLKLPGGPQNTALGGINISNQNKDINIANQNPALLRDSMDAQLSASFNAFFAGIGNYHLMYVKNIPPLKMQLAAAVIFFNYGKTTATDAAGNIMGSFHPMDYVVTISAAQEFKPQWHYGINLKYIQSAYGQYTSNGIAGDFGITYTDENKFIQVGFLAKNMGSQIKAYGTEKEDLPFDVQLGLSKKLSSIPLQFSITLHHLHQFDIRYQDSTFNENIYSDNSANKKFTTDKIFRHVVLATQFYIGDKIELTVGYNHLRRTELKISSGSNGFNGVSFGLGVLFNKIQFRYATGYYQNTKGYHQFGINMNLREYFNWKQ